MSARRRARRRNRENAREPDTRDHIPGLNREIIRHPDELVIRRQGAEDIEVPGDRRIININAHNEGNISVQIEHMEGKGIEVVYRKSTGEVLRRIAVAQVDENGRIHANHREKIESANTEYGIVQDRLRFFGEATKPKTPYGEAMKKWEDALERQRFGIENYKKAIKEFKKIKPIDWKGHAHGLLQLTWLSTMFNWVTAPIAMTKERSKTYKAMVMRSRLKKEEKKYQEMLNDASNYFKIESNLNTREIKCSPSPDGAKIFMEEFEKKKSRNLAQEKSLGNVELPQTKAA